MRGVLVIPVSSVLFILFSTRASAASKPSPLPGASQQEDHRARASSQNPPLSVIQGVLITSAEEDFGGNEGTFASSVEWHVRTKLAVDGRSHRPAAYLACTAPGESHNGWAAFTTLRAIVSISSVRIASSSEEHGVCFFVTATPGQVETVRISSGLYRNATSSDSGGGSLLSSWLPYPSTLKLSKGLLDHEGTIAGENKSTLERDDSGVPAENMGNGKRRTAERDAATASRRLPPNANERLTTNHGKHMKFPRKDSGSASRVKGLMIQLAPGVLPAKNRRRREAEHDTSGAVGWYENSVEILDEWLEELLADTLNMYESSFWSSESGAMGSTNDLERSALLVREWTRAADVLHDLGGDSGAGAGPTVGDACSWHEIHVVHTDDDLLTLQGIDPLLPGGRGVGGTEGPEADELQVACFMGLLSYLAARPEVLHVSAAQEIKTLNAAAFANVQSATLTETPLTDAGLDGSGEVIQIVDTGLDYHSCFFIDEDGEEVAHGHYFEEMGVMADALSTWFYGSKVAEVFTGGDFHYDLGRRKIVQYIDLVRQDRDNGLQPYGASWASTFGQEYPWISPIEFSEDYAAGHGTHTAGSAAGATINTPATTETCSEGRELSCVGGCIETDDVDSEDDLVIYSNDYYYGIFGLVDLDRLCPRYSCDGAGDDYCLGDDEATTLAEHGGVARGAKLAIFDILDDYTGVGIGMAGNGIWDPAVEAGSKIHSNSWGASTFCELRAYDILFDHFMYTNPEHLLIFAAGNDGGYGYSYYGYDPCTLGSPATSKNSLAVGASTSGPGRLTLTGMDGSETNGYNRVQDIDAMAYFSSYGPTLDGRIKPDVVAPGDMVYSAAGSVTGNYTCRLWQYPGTSMSTPIVAGSAALVRQYFTNETFYAHDVEARGFCDSFGCEAFRPSGATVKAMLINSANLMGGSTEPNGTRGFGRVHLEPGMPLGGEGQLALFVADSLQTRTPGLTLTEYSFEVDGSAGLDLRATLAWIDPPATALSSVQLVHDLDLAVYSPQGTRFSMWASGLVDTRNNVERVIVPAENVSAEASSTEDQMGTWGVRVWSKRLAANETQSYSLVVTGAIMPPGEESDGTVARVRVTSTLTSFTSTDGAAV